MCGIAGVISWSGQHRVTREVLAKMSAAIAHRGPDGEGVHLSYDGEASPDRPQVGLVHRRLAILDPDPRSDQPFTDGRGRFIVFNGEIYNFRELRKELELLLPDYEWRTTGDTEVLLASYAAWGEKCVDRLNGMFAFAIWDGSQKGDSPLFLARDRMGQKPLYFATIAPPAKDDFDDRFGVPMKAIAFASELSALKPVAWIDRSIDESALTNYLQFGYIDSPATIYRGVREVSPGSTITIRKQKCEHRYYFSAKRPVKEIPSPMIDADAVQLTRERVESAVQKQLVSDVPIGCFLSGGVDSSIVSLCMTLATQHVRTFSIALDDARYDESVYAAEVAKHLGTRHETFTVRPNVGESLVELAGAFGQPFGDSSALPTYWLSKVTRQEVKVALSGDGGDELFAGYDRYAAIRLIDRVQSRLGRLPGAVAGKFAALLGGGHPKSKLARLARLGDAIGLPTHRAYAQMVRLFNESQLHELRTGSPLSADAKTLDDRIADSFRLASPPLDAVRAAMAVDRSQYLPGDLLTKVDRASMLHALEVRSPFMDHELVTFAFALTTDQLLRGGPKRMLREAFAADLPASVFARKKMGFAVPIGDWFRGELRAMLRDHLFAGDSFARQHFNLAVLQRMLDEHEQSRVDHSQRLYALLMLELWWRNEK